MTFFEQLFYHSKLQPNRLALADLNSNLQAVNYGELPDLVSRLLTYLSDQGLPEEESVFLDIQDSILLFLTLLALAKAGLPNIVICPSGTQIAEKGDWLISDRSRPELSRRFILVGPHALRVSSISSKQRDSETKITFRNAKSSADHLSLEHIELQRVRPSTRQRLSLGAARWLSVGAFASANEFMFVLGRLAEGQTIMFSAGSYEEDLQSIGLFRIDALYVQSSHAQDYFAALLAKRGLASHLRVVFVSGVDIDPATIGLIKANVSNQICIILEAIEVGVFGAAVCANETIPSAYAIPPEIEACMQPNEFGKVGEILVRTPNRIVGEDLSVSSRWSPTGFLGLLNDKDTLILSRPG